MDKSGFIQEHSKIKLELYRQYVRNYLSVLLASPYFDAIEIVDAFAGSGIAQNREPGSALIAAQTITEVNNPRGKPVRLSLNDADPGNCDALRRHLESYKFASVSCGGADDFIRKWRPAARNHNLIFVDPHGYTQLSLSTLGELLKRPNTDVLIVSGALTPRC